MRRTSSTISLIALILCALHGQVAADGPDHLQRANDILNRWVGRKDIASSLITGKDDRWSIRTTAAELYPALVMTAWHTNLDLYNGLLLETLNQEEQLTSRLTVFPDDYHLKNSRFVRSSRNEQEILINGSAYAGGLARIAAWVGPGPWTDRLRGIVDAMFLRADVATDFAEGALPSDDLRVTGQILKTLPLLASIHNDEGYLYYARRLGDAYCVGVLPKNGGLPAERWNFESDRSRSSSLILDEDGVSFIEGLVALYDVEVASETARADIYRPTLSAMFDVLFKEGLKENGRFHRRIQPDSRGGYSIDRRRESAHSLRLLLAAIQYSKLSLNPTYEDRAAEAFVNYRYTSDDYAEMEAYLEITGLLQGTANAHSLALAAEIPDPNSGEWNETQDGGILTALLAVARARSAGMRAHPWRADLDLDSDLDTDRISIDLGIDSRWKGVLHFQYPVAFRTHPNEFLIDEASTYRIHAEGAGGRAVWIGSALAKGLNIDIRDDYTLSLEKVAPTTPSP